MTDTAETRWESHNEAGRRLFSEGDLAAAEQEFIAAIREATSLGGDNVRLASGLGSLGQIKYRQKDLDQAEALFRRALAIRERLLGADHFSLVQAINNLASLHYSRGELDQAAAFFTRALEVCDKNLGEKHPDVAVTLNNLARLHFRRNDFVAAAPLLMRLLAIKQESLGAHHPEVAVILTSLAKVRLAEGQHEDAEQLARRALLIREGIHQPGDQAIATSLETLADIVALRGLVEEEQGLRKRIAKIRGCAPDSNGAPESRPPSSSPAPTPPASLVPAATPPGAATPLAAPLAAPLVAPLVAPPPGPGERTTRSASLPWIEPPTSPALRGGHSSRPISKPISRPVTAPASKRITAPISRATTAPVRAAEHKAAPARAATPVQGKVHGSVRGPLLQPPAAPPRQPRREVTARTRRAPRSRSPIKLFLAAAVLVACGGAGWLYLSRVEVISSAGAALDASSLRGESTVSGAHEGLAGEPPGGVSPTALTASPDPSYGAAPPLRRKPPAAAYSDDPPVNIAPASERTTRIDRSALDGADAPDTAATPRDVSPTLPTINVDRITSAIGERARARADSLGRKTMSVKAPDFEKPDKP